MIYFFRKQTLVYIDIRRSFFYKKNTKKNNFSPQKATKQTRRNSHNSHFLLKLRTRRSLHLDLLIPHKPCTPSPHSERHSRQVLGRSSSAPISGGAFFERPVFQVGRAGAHPPGARAPKPPNCLRFHLGGAPTPAGPSAGQTLVIAGACVLDCVWACWKIRRSATG